MGKTLVQKILSEKVGHAVNPGDAVVIDVDFIGLHDGSGPLAVRLMKEKNTVKKKEDPEFEINFQLGEIEKTILHEDGLLNFIEAHGSLESL